MWIKARFDCLGVDVIGYLSVSPHIRTDQGKTTDNDEDSTARHMQCKFVLEIIRPLIFKFVQDQQKCKNASCV